jgi:hypothetical protein
MVFFSVVWTTSTRIFFRLNLINFLNFKEELKSSQLSSPMLSLKKEQINIPKSQNWAIRYSKHIYHGHGLFLQFFGFFRSVEDLFTSAYNTRSQAVKQEAYL